LSATTLYRHVELEHFWQAFASRGFVSDSWTFLFVVKNNAVQCRPNVMVLFRASLVPFWSLSMPALLSGDISNPMKGTGYSQSYPRL